MSKSRLEKFLYALYSLDSSDLPAPLSRIEELYKCLVIGEEAPTFEPLSRVEKYLMAILGGYDVDSLPNPMSRVEVLLYKLATGDDNLDGVKSFLSEHEELLAEIIRNGGVGGNIDIEYVLYSLSTEFNTLYNTAEKPVKSAILKGNTDENLQSVKMPVLTTVGKNLFDEELECGVYTLSTVGNTHANNVAYDGYIVAKNPIKVNPNTTYTLSHNADITELNIAYLSDYNNKYVTTQSGNHGTSLSEPLTFTTPSDCQYIKFYMNTNDLDINIQIEQGSVTTYEPHKSNILTVNEDVTLRSNGDICDELNLLTRQLTQRIGEDGVVLSQEVVKTVDLSVVDRDGNDTKLSTFNDITHVTLSSEGLIPEAELEVATKNEEVLNTMSLEMDDISTTQTTLEETSSTQSENVDATMIATTEIYEGLL